MFLARQRLEFLGLVRNKYATFDQAIDFLKTHIPVTNPVTISLVNEVKILYPIAPAEKLGIGAVTALAASIEGSPSYSLQGRGGKNYHIVDKGGGRGHRRLVIF